MKQNNVEDRMSKLIRGYLFKWDKIQIGRNTKTKKLE